MGFFGRCLEGFGSHRIEGDLTTCEPNVEKIESFNFEIKKKIYFDADNIIEASCDGSDKGVINGIKYFIKHWTNLNIEEVKKSDAEFAEAVKLMLEHCEVFNKLMQRDFVDQWTIAGMNNCIKCAANIYNTFHRNTGKTAKFKILSK